MKLYTPSRISRRLGEKFFFKAERDATAKSAMVRRPYPPGMHGKRRSRGISEFGVELREKQKVRYLYGLSDTVLKRYVSGTKKSGAKTRTQALLEMLECRLDCIVYRLGFAPSRRIARQIVSHGHILVNGAKVRTPSRWLRPGDAVAVAETSRAKAIFESLALRLKKYQPPDWLELDAEGWSGKMKHKPKESDNIITQNLNKVIEYYSR